jgi:hypothetical protein
VRRLGESRSGARANKRYAVIGRGRRLRVEDTFFRDQCTYRVASHWMEYEDYECV